VPRDGWSPRLREARDFGEGTVTDWPEIVGDPRFFQRAGPFTLAAVADAAEAEALPRRLMLAGVAPLRTAAPDQVSFLDNRKYAPALDASRAGAVIVHPDMASRVPAGGVAIVTAEPYAAWAKVAALFHPVPPARAGIHPTAVIGAEAIIDPSAEIGPLAVIGERAEIGPRCRIGGLAVIGPGVVLGPDCRIGSHASLSHALLGARVYVYPGARIGQEGFGFAITGEGFHSVPQLCRVILEDDVEVGANSTIDRGSLQDTVIGAGSRLDNLVQIGHNARLGLGCVIVSQAGVSGSTILEDHVMVGPQAGLTGHLRIGRTARIGAQAGVMADVAAGTEVVGSPAQSRWAFFREVATLRRLAKGGGKAAAGDRSRAGRVRGGGVSADEVRGDGNAGGLDAASKRTGTD
jgi:UDP-3-O-[3-hydroxymyristoyl] glucosamine N-acyltransferase